MLEVASRLLRNELRSVLARVEAGEQVTITVSGRPVALLQPVRTRSPWIPRSEFVKRVLSAQADPALTHELRELAPGFTDDLAL